MGTQNTKGKGEREKWSGLSLPEELGCGNLHTSPNMQHMCALQKAFGILVLSASQWACWARVSTINNDKIVVHQ